MSVVIKVISKPTTVSYIAVSSEKGVQYFVFSSDKADADATAQRVGNFMESRDQNDMSHESDNLMSSGGKHMMGYHEGNGTGGGYGGGEGGGMMNSTEGGANEGGGESFEDSEGGDDGDDDKHMVRFRAPNSRYRWYRRFRKAKCFEGKYRFCRNIFDLLPYIRS